MTEKVEKVLYLSTHAAEDPEKAALPFVMANGAMAMDIKAVIALQGPGVYMAWKGYIDKIQKPGGFPEMKKLMSDFLELGGELRVCVPCIRERHIDESELIEGARTVAAGELNVIALEADAVFTY
ncbi:MAG: DsrE family protein [Pseudomonadota bacterium]